MTDEADLPVRCQTKTQTRFTQAHIIEIIEIDGSIKEEPHSTRLSTTRD